MKTVRLRSFAAAALSLVVAVTGLLVAAPAQAQLVTSGSFAVSGDPGEPITRGESHAYSVDNGDVLNVFSGGNSAISISIAGSNGDFWSLAMQAPQGETLVPGTYTGATRIPFNDGGVGLELNGNGSGCNELTGEFTIIEAVFGPFGYVQTFDATFEQHCEGGDPAARGEVHIANPPPLPQLDLTFEVATDGTANTVNGDAAVQGTVACNKNTVVNLTGTVVQVARRVLVRGPFATSVLCRPGEVTEWTVVASPDGTTPFQRGPAEVRLRGVGFDVDYQEFIAVDTTTVVTLQRFRP